MQSETDELLTAGEVSRALKIPEPTLATWRSRSGRGVGLPFIRLGRCVRYQRSAVNEFIANSTVAA